MFRASSYLTMAIVAIVSFTFITPTVHAHTPAEAMAEAANRFLVSLTPEQRQKAEYDFDGEERKGWGWEGAVGNCQLLPVHCDICFLHSRSIL